MNAREKINWMTRAAKRFISDFESDCGLYESDLDGLTIQHHSWVCSDDDLTPLGRDVRAFLLANPALIDA